MANTTTNVSASAETLKTGACPAALTGVIAPEYLSDKSTTNANPNANNVSLACDPTMN